MQQVEQAADGFKRIAIKYDPIGGFYALLDSCMPPVANLAARIRVTVLEAVMEHGPQSVVQSLLSPSLTHVLSALACLYLLSAVLATTRALNLFAFHPIFMSVGVLAFMTEGFLVYRNGALVSTFADIMAGSAKSQARSIHMVLQVSGSVFIFMGLVFICSNKMRLGKSLVPATLHAWVGTVATLLYTNRLGNTSLSNESAGDIFIILIGTGTYLMYIPASFTVFDRLVAAASCAAATCTPAIT